MNIRNKLYSFIDKYKIKYLEFKNKKNESVIENNITNKVTNLTDDYINNEKTKNTLSFILRLNIILFFFVVSLF